jgi:hypothetical protein
VVLARRASVGVAELALVDGFIQRQPEAPQRVGKRRAQGDLLWGCALRISSA